MPLYDQIIENIMLKINSHELKEGDMLPTEIELSAQFKVSRPTVRTAMLKLVNEGYLTRVKGRGTFVTKPKLVQESSQFIESYNEEMLSKGFTPRTFVLDFKVITKNDLVCAKLNISSGDKIILLRRLRYVQPTNEEKPVVLTTVYIPYDLVPDLLNYDLESFSLYEVLDKHGITVTQVIRELEIRMLYGKTARLLEAKENSAAHFISSTGYDADGRVVEYSESFYPADRNKFIIKVSN